MIKVVARSIIKEGYIDKAIELYSSIIEPTRAESACISYSLCRDSKNPNAIAMIEEWKDQVGFDAHLKTDHYLEVVPKLLEMTENKEVSLYEVIK